MDIYSTVNLILVCAANELKNEIDAGIYTAELEAERSDMPIPKLYKKNGCSFYGPWNQFHFKNTTT